MVLALLLLTAAPDLEAEAKRHTDGLISQHYNLTTGLALDKALTTIEFFIPEESEHSLHFWAEALRGSVSTRVKGPDDQVRLTWSGRSGEWTSTAPLTRGKYVLEVERAPGTVGRGLFGVKGPVVRKCELDPQAVHAAAPSKGFRWPYLLWVPSRVKKLRLLVAPNNTGFSTDDRELLEIAGSCELKRQQGLAERLGTPVLIPLFPRPAAKEGEPSVYLHALTRSSLETKVEAYRRVDLQLLAMIDDARAVLKERGVEVSPEVLLWGFSASASFVSRFAVLHPERVAAVAAVSPGGWPIAPGPDALMYPVGAADVAQLTGHAVDRAALSRVAWFFALGAKDENDSVPYRDSFSAADEAVISRRFGKTPVSRWKAAEQMYEGLDARFMLYPGVAHQVSAEMSADIESFFEKR